MPNTQRPDSPPQMSSTTHTGPSDPDKTTKYDPEKPVPEGAPVAGAQAGGGGGGDQDPAQQKAKLQQLAQKYETARTKHIDASRAIGSVLEDLAGKKADAEQSEAAMNKAWSELSGALNAPEQMSREDVAAARRRL